jgi:hypothetical protein
MNAFDSKSNYFDLIPVELYVRTYSGEFPNIYNVVYYACCREIFNQDSHKLIKTLQQEKKDDQPNLSDDEESKNRGVCLAEKLKPIENFTTTRLTKCPKLRKSQL